jgi:hypothetical protein
MSRVSANVRSWARVGVVVGVAALVLASCGTAALAPLPLVSGVPSTSISVPLTSVGCTTTTCVAVGTSTTDAAPTAVAEVRGASGGWRDVAAPTLTSTVTIQGSSCWTYTCLFVGQDSSGDVIWSYDASTDSVSPVDTPSGGIAVDAVNCYAPLSCAAIDNATGSGPRFETTSDGGDTWSAPVALPQTGDNVRSLACGSSLDCIVAMSSSNDFIDIYTTLDGGATWTPRTAAITSGWETLTSLTCRKLVCVGLAQQESGWHIVRTTTLGRTWSLRSAFNVAINTAPAFACATLTSCTIGGTKDGSTPWLATYNNGALTTQKLKYIPSPILQLACGPKVCAGIGVTTLLTLRASPSATPQ